MLQTTIRLALMSRQTSAATAAKAAAKTAASRRSSARSLLQAADDGKSHELAQPASLTVSQAARSLLKQELKLLQRQLSKCIDRWRRKPDHLHQVRISARRLQQHMLLFGPLMGKSRSAGWLKKQLKALLQASSRARDLDVLLHQSSAKDTPSAILRKWQQQRRRLQKPLRKLNDRINGDEGLKQHRQALQKAIQHASRRGRQQALANTRAADWAVDQTMVRLTELQTSIPASSSTKALHRFRLQVKQYRYQAELLLELSGHPVTDRLVQCLLQVQKQLGQLQDSVVAARSLKKVVRLQKKSSRKAAAEADSDRQTKIEAECTRLLTWLQNKVGPQLQTLARRLRKSHKQATAHVQPKQQSSERQ
jgi:CHAD domain-containing protein